MLRSQPSAARRDTCTSAAQADFMPCHTSPVPPSRLIGIPEHGAVANQSFCCRRGSPMHLPCPSTNESKKQLSHSIPFQRWHFPWMTVHTYVLHAAGMWCLEWLSSQRSRTIATPRVTLSTKGMAFVCATQHSWAGTPLRLACSSRQLHAESWVCGCGGSGDDTYTSPPARERRFK